MSETNDPFGFGKLVPGFDFLQNLMDASTGKKGGKGARPVPGLSSWIAPTLNVEELERRIAELKAVGFWLDQNGKALSATIQALEVQKMTLSALQGMNFAMGDVAKAFQIKSPSAASDRGGSSSSSAKESPFGNSKPHENPYTKSFESSPPAAEAPAPAPAPAADEADEKPKAAPALGAGMIDPTQWWTAVTGQFQQIAANAMRDPSSNPALQASREMTSKAMKSANDMATSMKERTQQQRDRMTGASSAAKKSAAAKKQPAAAARKSGATAGSKRSR